MQRMSVPCSCCVGCSQLEAFEVSLGFIQTRDKVLQVHM